MRSIVCVYVLLALVAATSNLRAETYRLIPAAFFNTYSATQTPLVRIKSGDRVMTSLVDDLGVDRTGKTVAHGPNPQTGPFFVEGAEPGDLLVVTIEKLEPNRNTGTSAAIMAAHTVTSGALRGSDPGRVTWSIDAAQRVVRLDLQTISRTSWSARFDSPVFELPLAPTLGSIAVAPAGNDAVATTTAGPFGGNMNAAGIAAGSTIMLPVFHSGALLYLGHGHARHGDGTVSGTGIETSLDVELTVAVIKKREWPHSSVVRPSTVAGEFAIGWPRVETPDSVMAIGSGATMLEALQHATLELHHWLDDDFGLSERAVNIFVGQSIEYEVANVGETSFTIAAKARKSFLPRPPTTR